MQDSKDKTVGFDTAKVIECPCCGIHSEVCFNQEDYQRWKNKEGYMKHLMPYLSRADREVMSSGVCNECWEAVWADDLNATENTGK